MLFRLGDTLTTVGKGGLVVVPPGLPHVFGAAEGEVADVVVVLSPGIERFGYFEQLAAISRGEAEFASLLPEQHRYDVHFEDLPDWRSAPWGLLRKWILAAGSQALVVVAGCRAASPYGPVPPLSDGR